MRSLLIISLLFLSCYVQAQEEIDEKIEAMPYYSYGKGLGMTSPDSIYQLSIRFRMQNRVSFIEDNDGKTSIDGHIRRLRLRLDGYVGNPRFTYMLQLSFAPGDVGEIEEGRNLNIIRDAVVFYQPDRNWIIGFGQTKIPGNRQRFNSSGGLQLTDRSINNARFNIDRDFGLQVHYLKYFKDRFSYSVKTAVTTGEGRNYTDNHDLNLAYTGKLELYPFGSFTKGGEYFEGDLMREDSPRLMLSAAGQYNSKGKQSQGQTGEALYESRTMQAFFGDLIFKYRGLALMTSYMKRGGKNPLTYGTEDPQDVKFVYVGQGMDYQGSYIFPSDYEIIGRYSWQKVDPDIRRYTPDNRQFTLGLTKYIWEHAFKIQAEATYTIESHFDRGRRDNWYFRLQTEIGI